MSEGKPILLGERSILNPFDQPLQLHHLHHHHNSMSFKPSPKAASSSPSPLLNGNPASPGKPSPSSPRCSKSSNEDSSPSPPALTQSPTADQHPLQQHSGNPVADAGSHDDDNDDNKDCESPQSPVSQQAAHSQSSDDQRLQKLQLDLMDSLSSTVLYQFDALINQVNSDVGAFKHDANLLRSSRSDDGACLTETATPVSAAHASTTTTTTTKTLDSAPLNQHIKPIIIGLETKFDLFESALLTRLSNIKKSLKDSKRILDSTSLGHTTSNFRNSVLVTTASTEILNGPKSIDKQQLLRKNIEDDAEAPASEDDNDSLELLSSTPKDETYVEEDGAPGYPQAVHEDDDDEDDDDEATQVQKERSNSSFSDAPLGSSEPFFPSSISSTSSTATAVTSSEEEQPPKKDAVSTADDSQDLQSVSELSSLKNSKEHVGGPNSKPWWTEELQYLKHEVTLARGLVKLFGDDESKQRAKETINHYHRAIRERKNQFFSEMGGSGANSPQRLASTSPSFHHLDSRSAFSSGGNKGAGSRVVSNGSSSSSSGNAATGAKNINILHHLLQKPLTQPQGSLHSVPCSPVIPSPQPFYMSAYHHPQPYLHHQPPPQQQYQKPRFNKYNKHNNNNNNSSSSGDNASSSSHQQSYKGQQNGSNNNRKPKGYSYQPYHHPLAGPGPAPMSQYYDPQMQMHQLQLQIQQNQHQQEMFQNLLQYYTSLQDQPQEQQPSYQQPKKQPQYKKDTAASSSKTTPASSASEPAKDEKEEAPDSSSSSASSSSSTVDAVSPSSLAP